MKERKNKKRILYSRRVRLVTRSKLNAINKIQAINTLAIPVVTYSFNITNWQMSEIRKMNRKTRKVFTMELMNHPKEDVDHPTGRGLAQLELAYKTTTVGLNVYLEQTV